MLYPTPLNADASEPEVKEIKVSTTKREGYREYKSGPKVCGSCERIGKCTQSANRVRVVTRHVWEDGTERVNQDRLTDLSSLQRQSIKGRHTGRPLQKSEKRGVMSGRCYNSR